MGRFINLGIAIVNTSYIIRVEMESDGRAEIYGNTAQKRCGKKASVVKYRHG